MAIEVPIPSGPFVDDSQADAIQVPIPGSEVWLDDAATAGGGGGGSGGSYPKIIIF